MEHLGSPEASALSSSRVVVESRAALLTAYDQGKSLGAYMKLRAKNIEEFSELLQIIKHSIPARLFEIDRFEDESGKGIVMRYISGMSLELTDSTAKYIEGMFSCYSSNIALHNSTGGVVSSLLELRSILP